MTVVVVLKTVPRKKKVGEHLPNELLSEANALDLPIIFAGANIRWYD